jgi:hypothetical protein
MVFTFLKVGFKTLKLPTLKVIFVHEEQQSDFSFEYESSWSPYTYYSYNKLHPTIC